MAEHADDVQTQPANAVFALMDDRQFRFSVVRPALEEDKVGLSRLTTGKHQLRGFRNIFRAPVSLLLPVIADEANLSAELAERILAKWYGVQDELREAVAAKLSELGYEPQEEPFDEEGAVRWKSLKPEHAEKQYEGSFLENQDSNGVMLMSLLLGWFGADEEEEEKEAAEEQPKARRSSAKPDEGGEQEKKSTEASEVKKAAKKSPAKKGSAAKKTAAKKTAAKKTATKKTATKKAAAKKSASTKSSKDSK